MRSYRLTNQAQDDIANLLRWSAVWFGPQVQERYERLVTTAIRDVTTDPDRPGSVARPEIGADARAWHLRGSRERARSIGGLILKPRHLLIYRPLDGSTLLFGRVLHEAMDPSRHAVVDKDWR